jgi:aminoglycoside phosphotransferase (APT) family kinase protein
LTPATVIGELGDSVEGFPAHLRNELQATAVEPLPRGTSPARVFRVATPDGDLAVKVLRQGAGIAPGQDIARFLQEPAQLQRVRKEVPQLARFFVTVLGVWQQMGWAAYAMPYVDGSTAVTPHRPRDEARDRLTHAFGTLTELGYARTRTSASGSVRPHDLGELRRRLWILHRHVPRELLDGRPLKVNGRWCRPLEPLIQAIEGDTPLLTRIRPRVVSYPVHGELDLANMLTPAGSPSFTLIDPRGTRGYSDPVDDFARALLSMTTVDRLTASGVRVWRTAPRGRRPLTYEFRSVDPDHAGYARLGAWFVGMLGSLPFGVELTRVDPYWRVRLAFSHAVQALLEASARLSARTPPPTTAGTPTPAKLATAFCAVGIRLLEQALAGAGSTDLPDISTGLDDDTRAIWRWGQDPLG